MWLEFFKRRKYQDESRRASQRRFIPSLHAYFTA
jgi:hypothetical protein